MKETQYHTVIRWIKILRLFGIIGVLCFFLTPTSYAQNTKGDKPQSSGSSRESRIKGSQKKKVKGKKSFNRAQGRKSSKAGKAQSSKPTKIHPQKGPFVNNTSGTSRVQRQNLKSSTSKSRAVAKTSSSQTRNVYPQKGPFINNPSKVPDSKPPKVTSNKSRVRAVSKSKSISATNVYTKFERNANNISRPRKEKPYLVKNYSKGYRPVKTPPKDSQQRWRAKTTPHYGVRSVSGKSRNVYSQKGPFINNPSQKTQRKTTPVSNQQIAKKNISGSRAVPDGKPKKRKGAISASRPYISRKSINAFAGFWNKKPKGEKAYTKGDLAGHPLRKKNYETKMPVIVNPTAHPYKPKKSVGDRPYKGPAAGGYKTATRPGKAWSGDITGRKIRGKNLSSKKTVKPGKAVFPPEKRKLKVGDTPYKGPGGGYNTFKVDKRPTGPLPGKTPGGVANKIDSYRGNIKGGGRLFTKGGVEFGGNLKTRRAAKGGGSVSGKMWNNDGQSLDGNPPLRRNIGYALFSGNKKSQRPLKGGGSVSGKMWNNKNTPLVGKTPSGNFLEAGAFSGNKKAQRPLKGGGSVSGKMWNNNNRPLTGKSPSGTDLQMGAYQGSLKATKKTPSKEVGGIPGKFKDTKPAFRDQGEQFTGFLKARKPGQKPKGQSAMEKYQGSMRASRKEPSKEVGGTAPKKFLDQKPPMSNQGEEFTGFIKLPRFKRSYLQNPNAADASLKKARPDKTTYKVNGLQVRVKQQKYGTKPNAAEGTMKGIVASKSSIKASEYSKVLRLNYQYIHNPSSAKEALKTREPGKAFARESDYQGNIKMKKESLFGKKGLHPDASFVRTNKNNVDSERSMLTNFKLFWAKLFGKNDLQPGSVRGKEKRPGYDKGEAGLWYNDHNSSGDNSRKRAKTPEEQ